MTLRPLFFLPISALRWARDQAYAEKLMDYPIVRFLFSDIDKWGIWFPYKGDEVGWTWPWRRKGSLPFVSLSFSGDGSFGDARFKTLKDLDKAWEMYDEACQSSAQWIQDEIDKKCVDILMGELK